MKFSLGILLVLMAFSLNAQTITGKVVDYNTGQPLAFVNILIDNGGYGVSSDINGQFSIIDSTTFDTLHFIYVGYSDTLIAHTTKSFLLIKMKSKNISLSKVDIFPGINPAHRIIKACILNAKSNRPDNLKSYSYKTYHKMIFTSLLAASHQKDSLESTSPLLNKFFPEELNKEEAAMGKEEGDKAKVSNLFKSQHLFIMESVSEHQFIAPNWNYEKLIGTRVSGFQSSSLMLLASQLQSFSFYSKYISILDKQYINPIAKSSIPKYFFLIEDTLFQNRDTLFIISFKPHRNTNFNGMQGVLYINSDGYAIQNVLARPADTSQGIGVSIQQEYKKIGGKAWFPVQLNTVLEFKNILLNDEPLVGVGKTYLRDIKINPTIKKNRVRNVILDIDPKASRRSSQFWKHQRTRKLDSLEERTYTVMDSLGKAEHFEAKLNLLEAFSMGEIPLGKVNIMLDKLINYNEFEGLRLGMGLHTNEHLLAKVSLMAYAAWGNRDYRWKYGSSLKFKIWPNQQLQLNIKYKNDVFESAQQKRFTESSLNDKDSYRNFLVSKMVYYKELSSSLSFRALPNTHWNVGVNYQQIKSPDNYQYVIANRARFYEAKGDFNIAELSIGLRYAFREKLRRDKSQITTLESKYPVLDLNYSHAFSGIYYSELDYDKVELELNFAYHIKFVGHSSWRIVGAVATGQLPWYKLYNGRGSYAPFYVESPHSFATMRTNEFLSDRFLAIYFRHDFGDLLFGSKSFVPHPVVVSRFTIGALSNAVNHKNLRFNTLEKGYYESGLLLNSILKSNISTMGVGVFYRYGPYAFVSQKDNFSYVLTLNITL